MGYNEVFSFIEKEIVNAYSALQILTIRELLSSNTMKILSLEVSYFQSLEQSLTLVLLYLNL